MELGDSLQFTDWERKRKNREKSLTQRSLRTQRAQRRAGGKNGEFVASDSKSPPFPEGAKDGAPSSTVVGRPNQEHTAPSALRVNRNGCATRERVPQEVGASSAPTKEREAGWRYLDDQLGDSLWPWVVSW